MAIWEEKLLVWDGVYDTVAADCNARVLAKTNVAQVPKLETVRVGLGETFHVVHSGIGVRMVDVTKDFVPQQGHAEAHIKLKRLHNIGWLMLRIFDGDDDVVYQESLQGKQIGRLPPASAAPLDARLPARETEDRIDRWSAIRRDGRLTFLVWVAKKAPAPPPIREIEEDVEDVIDALEETPPRLHAKLELGHVSNAADIRAKYGGWRIDDRKGASGTYHIVAPGPGGRLTVQEIVEPVEKRGVRVNDRSGRAWGKDQVDTGKGLRDVDKEKLGLNQTRAKRPHVRVISYDMPAYGGGGKGTNFALTEAVAGLPKKPPKGWRRVNRFFRDIPPLHAKYAKELVDDANKDPDRKKDLTEPKRGLDEDVSLVKEGLAKSKHVFDCAEQALTHIGGDGDDVLKVLLVPEFYFTHPDRPYTKNEAYAILDDLKLRSKKYKNWMFVGGSIWFADRHYEQHKRGSRKTYKSDGKKNKLTKVEDEFTKVVHNLTPVVMEGRLVHTYMKRAPSTIDGLRGYDSSVKTALTAVAKDINDGNPAALHQETWGRWVDAVKEVLVTAGEDGFFRRNGLELAVEVCLDHLTGVCREDYERLYPTGDGVDIHLLVAAGMPHSEPWRCLNNFNGGPCEEENALNATNCTKCAVDFSHLLCPECMRANVAGAAGCAHCSWDFADHRCAPCDNLPAVTHCAQCARLLGPNPGCWPVAVRACVACDEPNPPAATVCNDCGVNFAHRLCRACNAPNLPTATVCANGGCSHNLKKCVDCGTVGGSTTGPCGNCGRPKPLVQSFKNAMWDACGMCGWPNDPSAPRDCANGSCTLSDLDDVTCPGCGIQLAAGSTACTDMSCGWTDRKCFCRPHHNLPTDVNCTRCGNAILKPTQAYRVDHGNIPNIVARDDGYIFRNDGGYPSQRYSDVTKVHRVGNVAAKSLTMADLTLQVAAHRDAAFNAVSQGIQAAWEAVYVARLSQGRPMDFGLDVARVGAICTKIKKKKFKPDVIRKTKIADLAEPHKSQILASVEVQSVLTGLKPTTVDRVVVYPMITNL